jgi:hypothetical protein
MAPLGHNQILQQVAGTAWECQKAVNFVFAHPAQPDRRFNIQAIMVLHGLYHLQLVPGILQ